MRGDRQHQHPVEAEGHREAAMVLPERELAFLETVHTLVEEHLGDTQFGVERLAEDLSMSRRQLSRKLRALVEETPVAMLQRMRLERAVALLNEGLMSVKEVAFAVGFQNRSSFSRVFRQVYGVSPSDYGEQRDLPESSSLA